MRAATAAAAAAVVVVVVVVVESGAEAFAVPGALKAETGAARLPEKDF